MIDNDAIAASIQTVFDENGGDMTLTRTARDGTTTPQTVIGFRAGIMPATGSVQRRLADSGADLGDSEIVLEANANPKVGDVLDVFGVDHVIRPPVIQINPLGTLFGWRVVARPLE